MKRDYEKPTLIEQNLQLDDIVLISNQTRQEGTGLEMDWGEIWEE